MIKTDYTKDANSDSLRGAVLTKYRFAHWLLDTVKNLFSDPVNLRDERIARLLKLQDGILPDDCRSLFRVEVPFTTDVRKACVTPAVMVSAGATEYPIKTLNTVNGHINAAIGSTGAYGKSELRKITGTVAVVTESCDGTMLLSGILEDFFIVNAIPLQQDGMLSQLTVLNSSEPKRISVGEAANAKDVYQIVITLTAVGGISWEADSQGPVFRGVSMQESVRV